ncbi:response regulator [Pseudonocardia cypriaca]|uniref:LuxR family two component transcriptional regulator n=1 Tax=Pseudonocardia cypriaca TaxID=882449 RepID=A0A543FXD6_9PSEU|nr:response regulator transcription factor [Pseudonocardia cypriaca]TQM38496.1 LuxR family two component transcriptional regulator [Pseudonocardia cypriaca]
MIDVLLADDQPLIRGGFRALLDAEPDIRVVGEAANGREAIELALRHRPDVALVDIQMPVLDGMATTRCIAAHAELADLHVVILTNYGFDECVFETLRAGASGYLVKDIEPEDLLHAVRVVAKGDTLLAPTITRKLIAEYVRRPPPAHTSSTLDVLTNREREVVAHVARGLSNDEIGSVMSISPTTAKTHVSRAMTKLGARDRAQLVVLAYESGLVLPRRHD